MFPVVAWTIIGLFTVFGGLGLLVALVTLARSR